MAGLISFIFAWVLNRKSQGILTPSVLDNLPPSIAGLPGATSTAVASTAATAATVEPTTLFGKIGAFFSSMIPSFKSVTSVLPSLPSLPSGVHVSVTGPDPSCPLPKPT